MENIRQSDVVAPGQARKYRAESLRTAARVHIGIDIGSTSSDVVALDDEGAILFYDYRRTMGQPIETVRGQLEALFGRRTRADVGLAAVTGSAGRLLAKLTDLPFVNEVPAQAAAICRLYPKLEQATVIDMGGQDSKLIFIRREKGIGRVRDFALNTVCAAGTGSFLDQQAQRLGVQIEQEFGELALQSKIVPRMAGRCSVFAKSDMIHLQQQATPICDIIAGLCLALARNLKGNLGCGREFVKPMVFTGGVAANLGVVRALEEVFELEQGELFVPTEHFFTGAIGAVLVARSRGDRRGSDGQIDLGAIEQYLSQRGAALKEAPRRQRLGDPSLPPPQSLVYEQLLENVTEPIEAWVGVDVGSLSTNVAVIDRQRRILAKAYLMTAGKPLEAVRQGMDVVGRKVAGKVKILGAASTGSGRYLTGDFIGADLVINEITAQAAGAAIVNPSVDTIFEIGGQDSKYISLENGVVVDFEMNHACAAGTGSFLEEQAQRLDIKIDREFAECAFRSDSPVKLGERCTVFMESDLLSYQQQGAKTEDLVAGLSYSIVANYLNRVVGRRKIGKNICFQGGTAFNKAVWAAFEMVTGKPILVPDHHEVTGALGAAAIAADYMNKRAAEEGRAVESKFRGFENLMSIEYTVESFACEHCPNHCEIKKVQLPAAEPLYYGSRCDRYNLKKKGAGVKDLGAFEYRRRLLLGYADFAEKRGGQSQKRATIGIPMALVYWQLLPLFARFFRALGFEVVLSGRTDKRIIRMGVESVSAQPCFPVKVAYGHIAELIDKKVDYIFLPSIVSMTAGFPQNKHNQLCPYVQSLAYQCEAAFGDRLGTTKILTLPIRLGEGDRLIRRSFASLGEKLGVAPRTVERAMKEGFAAQAGFERALKEKGRQILGRLGPDDKLFVLISRPYNGCDDGLNLRLPRKLAELGVAIIPMDMLDLGEAQLGDELLHERVYWSYGQKILRAAEIIRNDPRLFAIYLSNFSCGPDSFLMTFFKDIMGEKPCLQLEIDEHSADAGVITRLEAFLESLKNYRGAGRQDRQALRKRTVIKGLTRERTLYIPYMGDCAYGVASCLKAYGQPAEVMPIADEAALLQGRAFTSGKECLPCAITSGDMLRIIRADGFDPAKAAFFMPAASGPCRFGMYNCLHRVILRYAGAPDVPVIAPNQDSGFYSELSGSLGTAGVGARIFSGGGFMKDVWVAMVGIDLLFKLILRIRPFAADPRHAQEVYQKLLRQWLQAVEGRRSLSEMCELMGAIADYFGAVTLDDTCRKPRIGIVGEIYVRSHPFANLNVIARLEELGAACDLASLAEWIYYTNFTRSRTARRKGQMRDLLTNRLQDYFQHKIERRLAEPLERKFGKLADEPVEHVLELARPYMDDSFEGEAILSIGKTVEYHHQGFGGVVNVMPFTCMPSTIVSTQTRRVSADCGDMPILNLSFDGQEDPTLTTRLEAFVEQVASRQIGLSTVADLLAAKT
ncbi:MAG TPA: acyl-CoA dehydratase activase [Sedimentisphaerales bacterium]|nr:acyl-CoA dehydratase activase [Sedimentisphaerales bacterium]